MNLSDLKPEDVTPVSSGPPLKLSDLDRSEVQLVPGGISEAKYGGAGQQAIAGLEGVARGVSAGLSDIAETKLLGVSPEGLAGRQEANPGTATIGNVIGTAGLLYETRGKSLPVAAENLAAKLGAGVLTRGASTAAKIAGSAAEGAVLNAAQGSFGDIALGNPDLTAQKVLSYAGEGAIFGGALSGVGHGLEYALPKAAQKVGKAIQNLQKSAFGSVEEPTLLRKITPNSILDGMAARALEKDQTPIRDFSKNIGEMVTAGNDAAHQMYDKALPNTISKALGEMPLETAHANASSVLDGVSKQIAQITDNPEEFSSAVRKPISREWNQLFSEINDAKSAPEIYMKLTQFAKDTAKIVKLDVMPTAMQKSAQDAMRNIQQLLRNGLKDSAIWGEEAAGAYSSVSERYNLWRTAKENIQKDLMKKEASKTGFPKYVMDPADAKSLFSKWNDVSQDLRKSHLADVIEQAHNIATASENNVAAEAAQKTLSEKVSDIAKQHGKMAKVAEAMGHAKDFKPGMVMEGLSGVPVAGPLIKRLGNPYELGAKLGHGLDTLHSLGTMIDRTNEAVGRAARSIFTGYTRGAVPGVAGLSSGRYEKNTKRLKELHGNPQAMLDHVEKATIGFHDSAPNVSSSVQASTTKAIQFLTSKMPRPASELPLASEWEPSNSDKSKFNKYFNAVSDPVSALKQIKDGSLSNETMEALQTVYPDLLQDMRQQVISNLNPDKHDKLTYSTKIALSKFMGEPLDPGMLPQVVMSNQAAFMMPAKQGADQPKPSSKGLSKLDSAKRAKTQTEQDEEA